MDIDKAFEKWFISEYGNIEYNRMKKEEPSRLRTEKKSFTAGAKLVLEYLDNSFHFYGELEEFLEDQLEKLRSES